MIRYQDFTDLGKMGTFIGSLPVKKFISVESLSTNDYFRVWYWR